MDQKINLQSKGILEKYGKRVIKEIYLTYKRKPTSSENPDLV